MMKIAIIGGGFYGCYIAHSLLKKYNYTTDIDIYDREDKLLTRAATNNQCRLHLGFHYPRSPETIKQTIYGFARFKEDFSHCIEFPKHNYYAVHSDGYLNFDDYKTAMDEHDLDYEVMGDSVNRYFRQPEKIQGVVRVGEGVIKLCSLSQELLNRIETKVSIKTGTTVTKIDAENGNLIANGKVVKGYDLIVNTTYTEPNIGLPKEKQFDLKYEVTAMALLKAPFGADVALTIMDGPFVSLYPAGNGKATLSSVTHTPFKKCLTTQELESELKNSRRPEIQNQVCDKILQHGNEMLPLNLTRDDVETVWLAPKTKVRFDAQDQRLTELRVQDRLVSVLCGKLDAVHNVTDKLIEMIEEIYETTTKKVVDF